MFVTCCLLCVDCDSLFAICCPLLDLRCVSRDLLIVDCCVLHALFWLFVFLCRRWSCVGRCSLCVVCRLLLKAVCLLLLFGMWCLFVVVCCSLCVMCW